MERERMCIACRQMKDKKSLVRIVKNKDNEIFVDLTGKQNGRGAYVCKDRDCFNKLKKQKLLNKTFKKDIGDEVYQTLEEVLFGNN